MQGETSETEAQSGADGQRGDAAVRGAAARGNVVSIEPGVIRLTELQAAVADSLVEQRLARLGGEAHARRVEVMRDVILEGLAAVQREEMGR